MTQIAGVHILCVFIFNGKSYLGLILPGVLNFLEGKSDPSTFQFLTITVSCTLTTCPGRGVAFSFFVFKNLTSSHTVK